MAGNAVKRATEALVKAAQQAQQVADENESLTIDKRKVGGIAQVSSFSFLMLVTGKKYTGSRLRHTHWSCFSLSQTATCEHR